MGPNSSSAIERFLLGKNETKVFETLAPGGNQWLLDVHSTLNQAMDGSVQGAAATVLLETSEDGSAFTTVDTVNVVAGGYNSGKGLTGRFARIRNTGDALATVVAKPMHRVQPAVAL